MQGALLEDGWCAVSCHVLSANPRWAPEGTMRTMQSGDGRIIIVGTQPPNETSICGLMTRCREHARIKALVSCEAQRM